MTTTIQRSFAYGELAPEMRTKADLTAYSLGLKTARNVIIGKVGGIFNRPGTISITKDSPFRGVNIRILGNLKGFLVAIVGTDFTSIYRRAEDTNSIPDTSEDGSALFGVDIEGNSIQLFEDFPFFLKDISSARISKTDEGFLVLHKGYAPLEVYIDDSGTEPVLGWRHYTQGVFRPSPVTTPITENDPLTTLVRGAEGTTKLRYMFTEVDVDGVESTIKGTAETTVANRTLNIENYVRVRVRSTALSTEHRFYNIYKQEHGEWRLLAILPFTSIERVSHADPDPDTFDTSVEDIGQPLGEVYAQANEQITPYMIRPERFEWANTLDFTDAHLEGERVLYPKETSDIHRTVGGSAPEFFFLARYAHGSSDGNRVTRHILTTNRHVIGTDGSLDVTLPYLESGMNLSLFPNAAISGNNVSLVEASSAIFFQGMNPSLGIRYQGRQVFASTGDRPHSVWLSAIGLSNNFISSGSINDASPFSFDVRSGEGGDIQSFLDLNGLYIFGSEVIWRAYGNEAGVITPTQINLKEVSNFGASSLPALKVGSIAIVEQNGGGIIRALHPSSYAEEESSSDISLFSNHFVRHNRIVAWVYQKRPVPIVWMVRDDGKLLSLTIEHSQRVLGWCAHDFSRSPDQTNLRVLDVATIDSEVYLALFDEYEERGNNRIHIVKLDNRFSNQDPVFTDNTIIANAREITIADHAPTYQDAATDEDGYSVIPFSGSTDEQFSSFFPDGSEDNYIFYSSGDEYYADRIASVNPAPDPNPDSLINSITVERRVITTSEVPAGKLLIGVKNIIWGSRDLTVGEQNYTSYSIVADGDLVISRQRFARSDVPSTIILTRGYRQVAIGHPFTSDIETLDIELIGPTIAHNDKKITEVNAYVDSTKGLYVGNSPPSTDGGVDELALFRPDRRWENNGQLVASEGLISVPIDPTWNSSGSVFFRQVDPLPFAIYSIVPSGSIPSAGSGGTGGQ